LKVPARSSLKPLLFGGAQEDSRRAGTENVAGAQALVATLEARHGLMNERESRRLIIERLSDRVVQQVPGAEMVGGMNPRLWNTVAVMLPEVDCRQRWVVKLDKQGFAVSTGSACSSGKEEPSPVLLAMGYSPSQAGRVLRFSSGWETQEEDWDALLNAIVRADRELRTSNVG
jgi:cysteine desulfurase